MCPPINSERISAYITIFGSTCHGKRIDCCIRGHQQSIVWRRAILCITTGNLINSRTIRNRKRIAFGVTRYFGILRLLNVAGSYNTCNSDILDRDNIICACTVCWISPCNLPIDCPARNMNLIFIGTLVTFSADNVASDRPSGNINYVTISTTIRCLPPVNEILDRTAV